MAGELTREELAHIEQEHSSTGGVDDALMAKLIAAARAHIKAQSNTPSPLELGWDGTTTIPLHETPVPLQEERECGCRRCRTERTDEMLGRIMICCSICGNKRCPHATDRRHACTNSNASGQEGSAYTVLTHLDDDGVYQGEYQVPLQEKREAIHGGCWDGDKYIAGTIDLSTLQQFDERAAPSPAPGDDTEEFVNSIFQLSNDWGQAESKLLDECGVRLRALAAANEGLEADLTEAKRQAKYGLWKCTPEHTWAEWTAELYQDIASLRTTIASLESALKTQDIKLGEQTIYSGELQTRIASLEKQRERLIRAIDDAYTGNHDGGTFQFLKAALDGVTEEASNG
jgi:hypothetical protein